MNGTLSLMSMSSTDMIRMDHTHVFAVFHRYKADTSSQRKSALVSNACLAIEMHAQFEEEARAARGSPGGGPERRGEGGAGRLPQCPGLPLRAGAVEKCVHGARSAQ